MSDTSLRFDFLEGRNTVIPATAKTAAAVAAMDRAMRTQARSSQQYSRTTTQELFRIDNVMRSSARRMVSHALLIGGALAAASGPAVALTAAIWPLVGALGAIPAVGFGAVAGLAALITGFVGLGAAMRKTGGGAGPSASAIAAAQRRIEMANRSLRDSQEDLNEAWETASDRLRDIQTQYAGAQLDVEAAALAVRDAELALRQARSSGDRQERARADLALRQARLNQVEATNRLTDVEQEYQQRMAAGVEGSEEVRTATERQADALHELAEAQRSLDEAMRGGGGGGDDAYAKLSRSGRELVDTLRRLGPEWRKVQQATQEGLLAGAAGHVQRLSDVYFPVMLRQLPALAGGWNALFGSVANVASTQGFVADIDRSLGNMAVGWRRVGGSFGSFFSGFRHWIAVGSEFMPRMGSWVDRQAVKFDLWSQRVRQSGKAFGWIENAVQTGHKLNELFKSWGRSLFELGRLGQDATLLDRLIQGSQAFERWLATAEGQERITLMWERAREVGSALWEVIKAGMDILSQLDIGVLAAAFGLLADGLGVVAANMSWINVVAKPLITALVAAKVATLAFNVTARATGAVLSLWPARMAAAETAAVGMSAALGPAALLAAGFWTAYEHVPEGEGWQTAAQLLGGVGYALYLLEQQQPAMGALIDRTGELNAATQVTADTYHRAAQELEAYNDLLQAQSDPVFAFVRAQERAEQAQQRVNDAIAQYGEGSPQHIQAVRDLQEAVFDLNAASVEAAKVDETLLIPQLQRLEEQGLLAAGSANAIADGLRAAKERAQQLDQTRATVYINQIVSTQHGPGVRMGGGTFLVMHEGGVVPGRRGEEVAAILQAGERVTPLSQADKPAPAAGPAEIHVYLHEDPRGFVKVQRKEVRRRGGLNVTFAGAS